MLSTDKLLLSTYPQAGSLQLCLDSPTVGFRIWGITIPVDINPKYDLVLRQRAQHFIALRIVFLPCAPLPKLVLESRAIEGCPMSSFYGRAIGTIRKEDIPLFDVWRTNLDNTVFFCAVLEELHTLEIAMYIKEEFVFRDVMTASAFFDRHRLDSSPIPEVAYRLRHLTDEGAEEREYVHENHCCFVHDHKDMWYADAGLKMCAKTFHTKSPESCAEFPGILREARWELEVEPELPVKLEAIATPLDTNLVDAVKFMLFREEFRDIELPEVLIDTAVERLESDSRVTLYYYRPLGFIVWNTELKLPTIRGGILSEEEGIRKRIAVLGLVASTPWPFTDPKRSYGFCIECGDPMPRKREFEALCIKCIINSAPAFGPIHPATVIVVNRSDLKTWTDEIALHSLTVTVWSPEAKKWDIGDFDSDIILTDYETVQGILPTGRKRPRFKQRINPLFLFRWHRLIMDDPSRACSTMNLGALIAERRWVSENMKLPTHAAVQLISEGRFGETLFRRLIDIPMRCRPRELCGYWFAARYFWRTVTETEKQLPTEPVSQVNVIRRMEYRSSAPSPSTQNDSPETEVSSPEEEEEVTEPLALPDSTAAVGVSTAEEPESVVLEATTEVEPEEQPKDPLPSPLLSSEPSSNVPEALVPLKTPEPIEDANPLPSPLLSCEVELTPAPSSSVPDTNVSIEVPEPECEVEVETQEFPYDPLPSPLLSCEMPEAASTSEPMSTDDSEPVQQISSEDQPMDPVPSPYPDPVAPQPISVDEAAPLLDKTSDPLADLCSLAVDFDAMLDFNDIAPTYHPGIDESDLAKYLY